MLEPMKKNKEGHSSFRVKCLPTRGNCGTGMELSCVRLMSGPTDQPEQWDVSYNTLLGRSIIHPNARNCPQIKPTPKPKLLNSTYSTFYPQVHTNMEPIMSTVDDSSIINGFAKSNNAHFIEVPSQKTAGKSQEGTTPNPPRSNNIKSRLKNNMLHISGNTKLIKSKWSHKESLDHKAITQLTNKMTIPKCTIMTDVASLN